MLLAKTLLVKEKSERRHRSSDRRSSATSIEKIQTEPAESTNKRKSTLDKKEIMEKELIEKTIVVPGRSNY